MNDITQITESVLTQKTELLNDSAAIENPSSVSSNSESILINIKKRRTALRMISAFTAGMFFSVCLFSAIICGSLAADKISSVHKTVTDFLLNQMYPTGYTMAGFENNIDNKEPEFNYNNTIDSSGDPHKPSQPDENNPEDTERNIYNIIKTNLAPSDIMSVSNETSYSVDAKILADKNIELPKISDIKSQYGETSPAVLIIHTHGSESYDIGNGNFRTNDSSHSVISVGDIMTEVLENCGIPSLHCREAFDAESYIDSYRRCAEKVISYLEEYPSIKYVFDVHRDAIIKADNTVIAPAVDASGKSFAQYMIVAGSNQGGADFPAWEDNLSFASKIQKLSSEVFPSVSRNLNLRTASFNQQYAVRSLLLEIGSAGNSLEEAKRTGAYLALLIADILGSENLPEDYLLYSANLNF